MASHKKHKKPTALKGVKVFALSAVKRPATGKGFTIFKSMEEPQGGKKMTPEEIQAQEARISEGVFAKFKKFMSGGEPEQDDLHVQVASLTKSVGEIKTWLETYEPVEKSEEDAGESDIENRLAAVEARLPTEPEGDEAPEADTVLKSLLDQMVDFSAQIDVLKAEVPGSKAPEGVHKSVTLEKRDVLAEVAGIQRR